MISYHTLFSQNKALDSLINKIVDGQSKIIILKNDTVYSITSPYRKIIYNKTDSLIKINFENHSTIFIKKKEFWGIVTDFEERRRYYQNEIYVIWRTKQPYIYLELKNRNANHYFFSESLTSNIYKLNELNIDATVNDSITKNILKTFYRNNKIDLLKQYDYSTNKNEKPTFESIIEHTVEVLNFIYPNGNSHKNTLGDPKKYTFYYKKKSNKNTLGDTKKHISLDPPEIYQPDSSLYR